MNPRRTHCIASRTTRCAATPRVRKECADQVMASGLHHRVPECFIDEVATRHPCCVGSTARRCIQYRKRHAMRDSIDGCASHTVREARHIVGSRLFCFRNVSRQPSAACASAPANRLHIEKATARYTCDEHFRSDIGRASRRRKPIRATGDLRGRSVIARSFCATRAVGLNLARIRPAIAASVHPRTCGIHA